MIRLEAVEKIYTRPGHASVTALAPTDLEIHAGEIFGIIGRSGAGKSTLLRMINLLERPSSGRIWLKQEDLTALPTKALPALRRRIGMVFQQFNLLASRTVFDNVALPLELTNTPRQEIRERVTAILDLVGLAERGGHYPAQLSGGQKQRVGIARALVVEPEILLCDEVTSALDPETTRQILDLLQSVSRKLGLTTIAITHEMSVVKHICDRVAVMDAGRIVETGNVFDIFASPAHPTTRAMIEGDGESLLPEALLARLTPAPAGDSANLLLRLVFKGRAARAPLISRLGHAIESEINVVAGRIDYIGGQALGTLFIEVLGGSAKADAALRFLSDNNQSHEVLGYVPAND